MNDRASSRRPALRPPTGGVAKFMRRIPSGACLIAAAALAVSATAATAQQVYQGMTADELTAFAERQGWSAEKMAGGAVLDIRVGESSAVIELFDCDEGLRCRAGVIRTISYHFLTPDRYGFWHWNLENHGATGHGPSYVTLERYLHFVGVTDDYLRDVIGRIWPEASQSFWATVEERSGPR